VRLTAAERGQRPGHHVDAGVHGQEASHFVVVQDQNLHVLTSSKPEITSAAA
jgi:hypothetical protein